MQFIQNQLPQLIGKKIRSIWLGKGEDRDEYLKFIDNDKNEYIYSLDGDCCSETFFDKEKDLDYVLNREIYAIHELRSVEAETSTRQDVDLISYIIIEALNPAYHDPDHLNAGLLIYRNSSNGYYAGSINFLGEKHPVTRTKITWKLIKSK